MRSFRSGVLALCFAVGAALLIAPSGSASAAPAAPHRGNTITLPGGGSAGDTDPVRLPVGRTDPNARPVGDTILPRTPQRTTVLGPAAVSLDPVPSALADPAGTGGRLSLAVNLAMWTTTQKIPYVWGGGHGGSPSLAGGADCSGLVRWVYSQAFGIDLGGGTGDSMVRTSGRFALTTSPVPGDLVLFGNYGRAPAYHVGLYIGKDGAGKPLMANTSTPGTYPHVNSWVGTSWSGDFLGYWHLKTATTADSNPVPVDGDLDVLAPAAGGVQAAGWAYDAGRPTSSASVRVTVDGAATTVVANRARTDLNADGIAGNHGFSATVAAAPGAHTVCLTALPLAPSSKAASLGCGTVTVPRSADGRFEAATAGQGSITIRGWAVDPNRSQVSNTVKVVLDTRYVTTVTARVARPDVDASLHIGARHGFQTTIAATAGLHTVCAISLAASPGTVEKLLGCKQVTVT